MSKNKKRIGIALIALVVLVAVAVGCWFAFGPKGGAAGSKTLNVTVVLVDGSQTAHALHTDAEFLGEALTEAKLIEGEQGAYGLFITTVDGVTADDSKQQWWCITKGGETVMTAADTTPIADGDAFELTLTEGY